jgi:glycerophosphoryl diester phosphodiesterase
MPLLGDFDGDRKTDVFWYGPGDGPDHHWYGRSNKQFGGVAITVVGTYRPITGDFDGDGRVDIFWYGPGDAGDSLWYGKRGHDFGGKRVSVPGTYEPFTGDFDGDGRRDIFWYGPGDAADVVSYGLAGRGFAVRTVNVPGSSQARTGDFDGDKRTDVLWYGPGDAADLVWFGRADRGFTSKPVTIAGSFEPLVRDFDGDGKSDVIWYGQGDAEDLLWFGRADRGFTGNAVTVGGNYRPFVGDFDGDRRGDVFWYAPGRDQDAVWYGRRDRGFSKVATRIDGTYRPMVGDFNGDRIGDVFWYAAGPTDDKVWFGRKGRAFGSRPTTIDLDYNRAEPLRQERLADSYTPFGFIAHANGGIDGHLYTNSLEAFASNYARGFRVFETDFVRLGDGTVFAAHDGIEASYGLTKLFKKARWAELARARFAGRYTPLRSQDVVELLRSHPDAYVILDTKYDHFEIFKTFLRQTGRDHALMDRIIPHIRGQADLDQYRTVWPLRNYIVALYRTQSSNKFDDAEVARFVRNNRAPGVMMWWRERDPSLTLARNGSQQRRFSPAFVRQLQAGGAVVEVHSVADPAVVARYEALGVGIYSNAPFGPQRQLRLQGERRSQLTPDFAPGVVPA